MRFQAWSVVLACLGGCATSPEAPLSSATLSSDMAVRTSRAKSDFVSYNAPYHRWLVTFGTTEGCGGDTVLEVEVDTLSSDPSLPIGTHTLRTVEGTIASLPSAYARYGTNTITGGTMTISSADSTYVNGSVALMGTVGGVATTIAGTFGAPACD